MIVFYTSDGEQSGVMTLEALMNNFDAANLRHGDRKRYSYNPADMRDELESRGWYEGLHDFGHYLVLNLAKLGLTAKESAP